MRTIFGVTHPIRDVVAQSVDEAARAYPHQEDDRFAIVVADIVTRNLVRTYVVATIGGDQFALVPIRDASPAEPVRMIA